MPTRYARISVVRDPALDEALRSVRGKLQANSEAARLRELALIGAGILQGGHGDRLALRERLRERYGACPPSGDLLLAARAARRADSAIGPPGRESLGASLAWARGDR